MRERLDRWRQGLNERLEGVRAVEDQILEVVKGRARFSDRLFCALGSAVAAGFLTLDIASRNVLNESRDALFLGVIAEVAVGTLVWSIAPRLGFRG